MKADRPILSFKQFKETFFFIWQFLELERTLLSELPHILVIFLHFFIFLCAFLPLQSNSKDHLPNLSDSPNSVCDRSGLSPPPLIVFIFMKTFSQTMIPPQKCGAFCRHTIT